MPLNPVKIYIPKNNGKLTLVKTIKSDELHQVVWNLCSASYVLSRGQKTQAQKTQKSYKRLKYKLSKSEYFPQHTIDEIL